MQHRTVTHARTTVPWDTLTAATLGSATAWSGSARMLLLTLQGDGVRIPIVVRRRGRPALSPRQAEAAARMVTESSIEMPRAKEDPRGRFSRQLFPSNLTREEAAELLRRPPLDDEPLPVAAA